jgi:hypothetical protein
MPLDTCLGCCPQLPAWKAGDNDEHEVPLYAIRPTQPHRFMGEPLTGWDH